MKTRITSAILGTILVFLSISLHAQQSYVLSDSSAMSITGTSTLHDWESTVNDIKVDIKANLDAEKPDFKSFNLTVPVESIKSHKSKMDKETYEALKQKKHPNITFELTSIQTVDEDSVTALGNLTIAGTTQPITIKSAYSKSGPWALQIKGAYTLNMTNYEVDPPKVMFGTIKAGEEVTIHYNLYLQSVNL